MGFEIRDGKERIPDEEDVYGVNDIEERDFFESLFGGMTQEERVRHHKARMRLVAILVVLAIAIGLGVFGLRYFLTW